MLVSAWTLIKPFLLHEGAVCPLICPLILSYGNLYNDLLLGGLSKILIY